MLRTILLLSSFALIVTSQDPPTQICSMEDSCQCTLSDGSGVINLRSLASKTAYPRWQNIILEPYSYSYNPCQGFDFEGPPYYSNLAILQQATYETTVDIYDLGVQSKSSFLNSVARGNYIKYVSQDELRTSFVVLLCEEGQTDHLLEFAGELVTTEYEFILASPCACPGGCDDDGPINKNPGPNAVGGVSYWDQLSYDLVGILLHDLILVAVLGTFYIVMKYVLGFVFCEGMGDSSSAGIGNPTYNAEANA